MNKSIQEKDSFRNSNKETKKIFFSCKIFPVLAKEDSSSEQRLYVTPAVSTNCPFNFIILCLCEFLINELQKV